MTAEQEVSTHEDPDIGPVIEVARTAIGQQFDIAERLDTKARGLVTIGGAWYAVVTTVAGQALAVENLDRAWVGLVAVCAAAGAVALLATIVSSSQVWRLIPDKDLSPEALAEMRNDALAGGHVLGDKLLQHYAVVLRARVANNDDRARAYKWAQRLWVAAMFLTLLELAASFAARIFG